MKRLGFLIIAFSLFFNFLSLKNLDAAMNDYCVVPPYVIQDVAPNVMIVLDNSGSMFYFSYFDGFNTTATSDDNLCANSTSPCTGFTAPGTYPTYKYYGYFNPDYWYTYSLNRFVPSDPKTGSGITGSRAKLSTEWDGDFLNWLTMRRIDVIRKVMTGGRTTSGEGSGYDRLIGEIADCDDRGKYKRINNAQDYTPYSGNRKFYVFSANAGCGGGGSGTSSFGVRNASDGSDGTGNEATFNVAIRVPVPVEGVLQDVIGTRARLGLSFYRVNSPTPQGGYVQVYVSGGSLSSTVNQINLTRPNSNTPLAETLWEMVGYFAQQATIEGGPGPRYNSGDFQINNNVDPYNYGTGGSPRWPSCSKSYVLYITDGEPCADGYLPANLRDYASGRSAYNCSGTSCPAVGLFPASTFPSCYGGGESTSCNGVVSGCYVAGIEDVALWAHTTDLRNSPTLGVNNMSGIQNLTLYAVFAFGKGSTLLRYAAINGGFEDLNGNNLPDLQSEWDQNSDNEPDNFYEADEGYALEQAIRNALSTMLRRASSGTAASVLASGEGSGANLVQAVFYPRRRIGNDIIGWIGEDQNMWFYVDPFFINSSIREDSTADQILNLTNDNIVQFYFDTTAQITKARRFRDTDGNGTADVEITPPILFENIASLWKAGQLLWSRTVNPSNPADINNRTIYTTTNGTSFLANNFTVTNKTALRPYLQAVDDTDAEYIIRYTHGEGLTTLLDEDGIVVIAGIDRKGTCSVTSSTSCTINANCPGVETCVPDGIDDYRPRYGKIGSATNVWKLGDILNSTPRISSWVPLNNYDVRFKDTTYSAFTATTGSTGYKGRGMVFAGGNDGMLHAFNLGKLELTWTSPTQAVHEIARLSGSDLGKEMWAFIPKNALPYLKYITDPDYCHVYSVDLSPYIFDASIGDPASGDISVATRPACPDPYNIATCTWRTILIGGMRYGGACRGTTTACTDVSGDGSKDCVNTPLDVGGNSIGYSSYFALDVTDQNNPQLLWEFSDPALGFATSGPAVVRIGSDNTKNGKWFVVFGSGPTGPIQTTDHQFVGRSDQNLKLFIFDIKAGPGANNANVTIKDTTIPYAFAGSMLNSTLDYNEDYQDDAVYIGYVKRTGTSPNFTWTDGGVGRLFTKNDPLPSNWVWSKVIDGIGPVTSSVARLQNNKTHILWLFFGSGRYYYEIQTNVDDADSQRSLFAVKEPCFTSSNILDPTCTTLVSSGDLTNVTSIGSVPTETIANSASFKGWYINLDLSGNYSYLEGTSSVTRAYRAERMITDPMATTTGLAFFTTYKPYNDECGLGGKSFIWAVRYNTGGPAGALLKGTALLQVSTGSIEQLNLSTAFTQAGGRKSAALEGVPPTAQGLSLLSQPPPVKRVIHMKER